METIKETINEQFVRETISSTKNLGKEFFELQETCHPFNQIFASGRKACTEAKTRYLNHLIDTTMHTGAAYYDTIDIMRELQRK